MFAKGSLVLDKSAAAPVVPLAAIREETGKGAVLTVLIVFLYLHAWRSTIITGLTLPTGYIEVKKTGRIRGPFFNTSSLSIPIAVMIVMAMMLLHFVVVALVVAAVVIYNRRGLYIDRAGLVHHHWRGPVINRCGLVISRLVINRRGRSVVAGIADVDRCAHIAVAIVRSGGRGSSGCAERTANNGAVTAAHAISDHGTDAGTQHGASKSSGYALKYRARRRARW